MRGRGRAVDDTGLSGVSLRLSRVLGGLVPLVPASPCWVPGFSAGVGGEEAASPSLSSFSAHSLSSSVPVSVEQEVAP